MDHAGVVMLVGEAQEVAPIRCVLEASQIATAIVHSTLKDSQWGELAADLEIICYDPRAMPAPRFDSFDRHDGPRSLLAEIAMHPVPVIVIHAAPSIWDVNCLRSCGAFYVLDRRLEERNEWRGLRDCVERALKVETRCMFCRMPATNSSDLIRGSGGVAVCHRCVLSCARDLLWSSGAVSRLAQ